VECPQRIFCERIPTFVAPYARRTLRLNEALRLIGLAVGGEAGSRLAIALGMSVSPDTIIQRIRQIQLPTPQAALDIDMGYASGEFRGSPAISMMRNGRSYLIWSRALLSSDLWP